MVEAILNQRNGAKYITHRMLSFDPVYQGGHIGDRLWLDHFALVITKNKIDRMRPAERTCDIVNIDQKRMV